ncbi:MAG TPA: FliM/FliN family flagellar motor C-terminal domain-containing protein [Edaphobacter sp.]|uniref:FliM/FliN family flagellar motor C-terminal domain-containing protein n=1 Tax=Edaphobacter sp. TaxID=1934404 RepID=UPI002BD45045|nr:FliM/FliN family flagellar motor C-terminal domain-containing protein [Edaphobacter sp.]HUZ94106.1 FliM/FliN family flagellar motor C-terminal domain-containing protein [Edaphobacter sp.]
MSTAAHRVGPQVIETPAPGNGTHEDDLLANMPWLPCTLTVELPVARFTIGDLLALAEGSIVETACHHTSDLPLRVNRLLIGWSEFNVVGDQLAVRITEQV